MGPFELAPPCLAEESVPVLLWEGGGEKRRLQIELRARVCL